MKTIHHVVDMDTKPKTVWKALAEPKGLAGWWSTKVEADKAAEGVKVHFTFTGDFNPVMEITELDEGRGLVWRCVAGLDPEEDSTFRIHIGALHDGRRKPRVW